jgi:hypothetical protein
VLFNLEDGERLRWIGSESDKERSYIDQEPEKRREGWREMGSVDAGEATRGGGRAMTLEQDAPTQAARPAGRACL